MFVFPHPTQPETQKSRKQFRVLTKPILLGTNLHYLMIDYDRYMAPHLMQSGDHALTSYGQGETKLLTAGAVSLVSLNVVILHKSHQIGLNDASLVLLQHPENASYMLFEIIDKADYCQVDNVLACRFPDSDPDRIIDAAEALSAPWVAHRNILIKQTPIKPSRKTSITAQIQRGLRRKHAECLEPPGAIVKEALHEVINPAFKGNYRAPFIVPGF